MRSGASQRVWRTGGLTGRIELRPTGVEALDEDSAFDLANVPIMFLPADVAERGLQAVWKALRPVGWALVQVVAAAGGELVPAMTRLLCALRGSDPTVPDRVLEMLDKAGHVDTAMLPSWPGPPARHGCVAEVAPSRGRLTVGSGRGEAHH